MKKLLLTLTICLLSITAQAQEELTNQSVLEMIELGFDKNIIIDKINSSLCAFDTDIDALKTLKDKGITPEILSAMIKASKATATQINTGIYAMSDTAEIKILPTVFSGSRTNTLAMAFSYGIASAKTKSLIQPAKSSNVLPTGECSFKFIFDPNQNQTLNNNNWWFRSSSNPNEFALVKLNVNERKNCRELEVGSINAWSGVNTGVTEKLVLSVEIEDKGSGIYIITPTEPIEPGEYCFYYKGVIPQGGYNNQSAFDFSVTN